MLCTRVCLFSRSKLTMPDNLQIELNTSGLSSGKSVIRNEDSAIGSSEEAEQLLTVIYNETLVEARLFATGQVVCPLTSLASSHCTLILLSWVIPRRTPFLDELIALQRPPTRRPSSMLEITERTGHTSYIKAFLFSVLKSKSEGRSVEIKKSLDSPTRSHPGTWSCSRRWLFP